MIAGGSWVRRHEAEAKLSALEAQVERLHKIVGDYAQHAPWCGARHPDGPGPECTCGLVEHLDWMRAPRGAASRRIDQW